VSLDFANAVGKYLNGDAIQKLIGIAFERDGEKDTSVHTVHSVGLLAWKDCMLTSPSGSLASSLSAAIQTAIDDERHHDGRSLGLSKSGRKMTEEQKRIVRTVLESMIAVGVDGKKQKSFYADHFEARFLKSTESFYRSEVKEMLQLYRGQSKGQLSKYMKCVEDRIEQESQRARDCMEPNTEKAVLKALTKIAIEDHASELVDASPQWFNKGLVEDQQRLFRLLKRTEKGLEQLQKLLEDRFDNAGKAAVREVKAEAQSNICRYADVLTEVVEECEKVVSEVFQNHELLRLALTKGCARFVNRNDMSGTDGKQSATHLAKCANTLLRTGSQTAKRHDGQQLDVALTRLISLIKYLEDKDGFQVVYTHAFARRLISHNYDAAHDRMMIKKLIDCHDWREFTHKLERMLSDVETSKELTDSFAQHLKEKQIAASLPELTITVGTFGTWPSMQVTKEPYLPQPLKTLRASFQAWYAPREKGRNLSWSISHCNVLIRTLYTKQRSYEILASVPQVSVLMQFDPHDQRSFDTLVKTAELDEPTALQALSVLVRQRLLLGPDSDKKVPGDTAYRLNLDFSSSSKKLTLISSQAQRESQEAQEKEVRTGDDRRFAIQAAIVRVIKRQSPIKHAQLVEQVTSELLSCPCSFHPQPQDIKSNIGKLIDKEQIEQLPEGQVYRYLP